MLVILVDRGVVELFLVVLLVQVHHLKVMMEEMVLELALHLLMVLVVVEVLEL